MIEFMKDGVNATTLPTVNTTGSIDNDDFRDTIDTTTCYLPNLHFYGEQCITVSKYFYNDTPLTTINTTVYIDHVHFLSTINPYTNKIFNHLFFFFKQKTAYEITV